MKLKAFSIRKYNMFISKIKIKDIFLEHLSTCVKIHMYDDNLDYAVLTIRYRK